MRRPHFVIAFCSLYTCICDYKFEIFFKVTVGSSPDVEAPHSSSIHFNNVTMSAMVSQHTGVSIVYSTVRPGVDQRTHQSSALLAFVRGIHRWPVNSPQKRASNAENVSIIWWRHHVFCPHAAVGLLTICGRNFILAICMRFDWSEC